MVLMRHAFRVLLQANKNNHLQRNVRLLSTTSQLQFNDYSVKLGDAVLRGDRVALSRSITLIESSNPQHELQAEELLEYLSTKRVAPGAGKSTFIETLGSYLVEEKKKKLAVVAVDPSSVRTFGSILGDKTRMSKLSVNENAFIRPSPTRGFLGGIAQHTNDVISLTEDAGFEIVIVETVGLGQSEILVDEAVDMLILLVPPAMGDELQGVKKGIMEVADMVVVNKADGNLVDLARHAAVDYTHAFQLARRKREHWRPRVRKCSALNNTDIPAVWEVIDKFRTEMDACGEIERKRREQANRWMWMEFSNQLVKKASELDEVKQNGTVFEGEISRGGMTPRHAARKLIDSFITTYRASSNIPPV